MTDSPYLCTIKSKLLEDMSKIALGTWAWGAGAFGGDAVFGSKTDVENLKPVFDAAVKAGLNLWDTATVYGMGESEHILGTLAKAVKREDVQISTKFTPQLAEMFDNNVEKMADASIERMGCDYIDIYWSVPTRFWARQASRSLPCRTTSPYSTVRQRKAACWTIARSRASSSGPTWCLSREPSLVNIIRRTRCLPRAIAVRSTTPCCPSWRR